MSSVGGCPNLGVVMCWHVFYRLHSMAGVRRELWRSFTWTRFYRIVSRQVLNISRGDSTASLDSLFQYSVTCTVKKWSVTVLQSFMIVVLLHIHTIHRVYEILQLFNKMNSCLSFQNSLNQFKFWVL